MLKNVSLRALTLKERSHSNLQYTLKIVLKIVLKIILKIILKIVLKIVLKISLKIVLKIVLKNNQQNADMEAANGWEDCYQAEGVQNVKILINQNTPFFP